MACEEGTALPREMPGVHRPFSQRNYVRPVWPQASGGRQRETDDERMVRIALGAGKRRNQENLWNILDKLLHAETCPVFCLLSPARSQAVIAVKLRKTRT